METSEGLLDDLAYALRNGECSHPFRVERGGKSIWVRCRSRLVSYCPSCAELYRGDWSAIARSGIYNDSVSSNRFFFLTLTAPSFGTVHRVPRNDVPSPCRCGKVHTQADSGLAGVPLDPQNYDYLGQVSFNRDSSTLWHNTIRRLRHQWPSLEFFVVSEWQARGVVHRHALIRIARGEAPSAIELEHRARMTTATSLEGETIGWGNQSDCQNFDALGPDGAKPIWYLTKTLGYALKHLGSVHHVQGWVHQGKLRQVARQIRCRADCEPRFCTKSVHQTMGTHSHIVSASRHTATREGWSLSQLTRTAQRKARSDWFLAQPQREGGITKEMVDQAAWARERIRARESGGL